MSATAQSTNQPAPTLSSRSLPRRVRGLLTGILEYASDELERGLVGTLNEFEQQMFKHAEQARNNAVQSRWLEALRLVRRNRPDLVPHFLIALEAELATVRDEKLTRHTLHPSLTRLSTQDMSLVEELEIDENTVLSEVASRAELRNSLTLYLLGQRFGVIAGKPAFDSETLPVGPQALCRMLRQSTACLELSVEHRLLLYRTFERQVMQQYGNFVDAINTYLSREHVLPHLQYVPVRARPSAQRDESAARAADKEETASRIRAKKLADAVESAALGFSAQMPTRESGPHESTTGPETGAAADAKNVPPASAPSRAGFAAPGAGANDPFQQMRLLLAGRRQLLGKLGSNRGASAEASYVVSPNEVQSVLGSLQLKPVGNVVVDGKSVPRTVAHLKQDLLARLRQISPDQRPPSLNEEDGDAIDLVGMLFDHIMKDVRPNSPAALLLSRMQVPLLRVALQDKAFFSQQQHPARQMLNAVAETGAYWLGEDDGDQELAQKMQTVVDRTVREFDGDIGVFQNLFEDINSHLQTVTRKAEVAERRHVEAARGKEKLALARERASSVVDDLLKQQSLPRFTHTLLSQAWTDVMALTALRHGEESGAWKQHIEIAERLIGLAKPGHAPIPAEDALTLRQEIESSLTQVGYHDEEANAIAHRLVDPQSISEDDAASRTELTMRLKARARLGEDMEAKKERKHPLSGDEKSRLEQLKHVPFGTWFEFIVNQQGDKARRRLSWFSTVTGHMLFVNHRGQKIGDHTLEGVARSMAQGQARIIEEERGSLIDRAWSTVMSTLRSFAGQTPSEAPAR